MNAETTGSGRAGGRSNGTRILQELRNRIIASIGVSAGGAVFILLYLGFFATRYAWYSNLAVVVSALVVVPVVLVSLWVHWGMGIGARFSRPVEDRDC
jgi:hypothetical protein